MRRYAVGSAIALALLLSQSAAAQSLQTLFSFNGADGKNPYDPVTIDASGNLYGTTYLGGASGDGTVFKLSGGSLTTLATFTGAASGSYPEGGVVRDAAGDLFGTSNSGQGAVFEVVHGSGTASAVAAFSGPNGANPGFTTMISDSAGNMYGVTAGGGVNGDGTVFEISKTGTFSTLASFSGANGSGPDGSLFLDKSGNLFGTANYGGANNDGTVFEVAAGSNTITLLASFAATGGQYPQSNVVEDAAGNIFGATGGGGDANGDGALFEIAKGSGSITTLAQFSASTGNSPIGNLVIDAKGDLFGVTSDVDTTSAGTVFELAASSSTVKTLVSFPSASDSFPSGGLTVDSSGNLYGTTVNGGAFGDGSIFEVTNSGFAVSLPEPASWVTMIVGIGAIGAMLRRRRALLAGDARLLAA